MAYMGVTRPELQAAIDALIRAGGRQTSGLRSLDENRRVGGVPNSYHLTGEAADIVGVPYGKVRSMIPTGYEAIPESDHIHVEPLSRTLRPSTTTSRSARPGGNNMPINPFSQYPDIYAGTKAAYGIPDDEARKRAVLGLIGLAAQRNMPQDLQSKLFGTTPNAPAIPDTPPVPSPAPANPFSAPAPPAIPQGMNPFNQAGLERYTGPEPAAPVHVPGPPVRLPGVSYDIPAPTQENPMQKYLAMLAADKPYQPQQIPSLEEYMKQRGLTVEQPMAQAEVLKKQRQGATYGLLAAVLAGLFAGKGRRGRKDNRLASGLLGATNQYMQGLQGMNDSKRQGLLQAYGGYQSYVDAMNKQNYDRQGDYYKRAGAAAQLGLNEQQLQGSLTDKARSRELDWQRENRLAEQAVNLNAYRNTRNEIDLKRLDADIQYKGERLGLTQQQIDFNKWKAKEQIRQSGEKIAETERHNRVSEGVAQTNAATSRMNANNKKADLGAETHNVITAIKNSGAGHGQRVSDMKTVYQRYIAGGGEKSDFIEMLGGTRAALDYGLITAAEAAKKGVAASGNRRGLLGIFR